MAKRSPLQELPLEHFLPLNPNLPSRKRPLSPGGPNLFSPTKRRILNEEGIFSPEKTLKSPIRHATSTRFTQVLMGPASPARKLDFGSPKRTMDSPTTPRKAYVEPTPKKLAPSPELKATTTPSRGLSNEDREIEEYFSQPSSSSFLPPPTSTSSSASREIPPPPDPQSIHYPGFLVHFDKHVSIEETIHAPPIIVENKEETKENLAPRRKPRKATTAPDTDVTSTLLSPQRKAREMERPTKAKSTPVTPKKSHLRERYEVPGSPTPQRHTIGVLREPPQRDT